MQTMARDARIDVDDVGHYVLNIMLGSLANIATKWRSECWEELSIRNPTSVSLRKESLRDC